MKLCSLCNDGTLTKMYRIEGGNILDDNIASDIVGKLMSVRLPTKLVQRMLFIDHGAEIGISHRHVGMSDNCMGAVLIADLHGEDMRRIVAYYLTHILNHRTLVHMTVAQQGDAPQTNALAQQHSVREMTILNIIHKKSADNRDLLPVVGTISLCLKLLYLSSCQATPAFHSQAY